MTQDNTQSRSLSDWLSYLEQIHPSSIELGLERVSQVARDMDLLEPAPRVITVAGTNGKGSTCALMESVLREAGYTVGVFSSPHMIRYNERVRINGKELDDAAHCQAFERIEQGRGETQLTYFEFGLLAALELFKQAELDIVLLEVGLGGRLDATNIVDSDIAVITTIDVDHVDWLGDDRAQIAVEKAGICRPGKPLISGELNPPATIAQVAAEKGALLQQVGRDFHASFGPSSWSWQSDRYDIELLPLPQLPQQNAATAMAALLAIDLPLTEQQLARGLANATLAGRFQKLGDKPLRYIDVAHNPESARLLAKRLDSLFPAPKRIHAVVGMLHDKDIPATLAEISHKVTHWWLADLQGPRAASASQLAQALTEIDPGRVQTFASVAKAWECASAQCQSEDVVIGFGSFYTVADILEFLDKSE